MSPRRRRCVLVRRGVAAPVRLACVPGPSWVLETSACPSNRNDALRSAVLVAKVMHVEDVVYLHIERRQHLVNQIRRDVAIAVACLPDRPYAVDHRMMRPEDWIERGGADDPHIA